MEIQNISIAGSGNAAAFFGILLKDAGFNIQNVISRNSLTGQSLAVKLDAEYTADMNQAADSDLLILCLRDDAIREIADTCANLQNTLVVHCAGGVSMRVLEKCELHGVIYPLQTLKGKIEIKSVPFLIEGNNESAIKLLFGLFEKLNLNFIQADSDLRMKYHLNAVFANNFCNAILAATESLSIRMELNFELLKPLIHKTFHHVLEGESAIKAQTGPAKRNDIKTMQKHLKMLETDKDLAMLYSAISDFIKTLPE